MTDQERRDYQRFVEVLSDRASAAHTIEFESQLLAEKIAAEKVEKVVEKTKISFVEKLLESTNMTEEQIAETAEVSLELVKKIKRESKVAYKFSQG